MQISRKIGGNKILAPRGTAIFLMALFTCVDASYGLLRYVLDAVSGGSLIYVPKILLLIYTVTILILKAQPNIKVLVVFSLLLISSIQCFLVFSSYEQVLFAIYILAPLLFGMYFGGNLISEPSVRFLELLVYFTISGLIVNLIGDMPWSGAQVDVGGRTVVAAKAWSALGISRLSGFSNASYSAATILMAVGTFVMCFMKRRRAIVYFVALGGIVLTTTKGAIAGLVIAGIFYLLKNTRLRAAYFPTVIALLFLNFYLPYLAYVRFLSGQDQYAMGDFNLSVGFFTLETMFDRMQWMWPLSMDFIVKNGGWLLGTGIGGIGAPLGIFYDDTLIFASADSLFVYLFAMFGALAVAIICGVTIAAISRNWSTPANVYAKIMILEILLFGLTGSPIERPTFVLFVGIAVNFSFKRKDALSQVRDHFIPPATSVRPRA
jgi:hypothetical protein